MAIVGGVGRAILGAIFGLFCFMVLLPLLVVGFAETSPGTINTLLWVIVAIAALSAIVAMRARRAFGVLLIELGLCLFTLAISIGLFTDKILKQIGPQADAGDKSLAALRDALSTGALSLGAGVVGAAFGASCLLIAYFLLRRDNSPAPLAPDVPIDTSRWSAQDREAYERQQRGGA